MLQECSHSLGIDLSDRLILNVGWRLRQVSTEQKPLKVVATSVLCTKLGAERSKVKNRLDRDFNK